MARIRMDTAEATRVAGQCLDKADALLQQMEHLRTSLDSLASSWSGRSYNRISPQFDAVVQQGAQIAEQLRALGEDLQRIATALEIADAGGTAALLAPLLTKLKERFARWLPSPSPPSDSELPDAPKNAQELFHTLQSMKEPIGLYKIGDNEYVVLIQGTKTGGGGRNWASAIQEALGIPTPYERKVREMIRQNIPKGATVHLVGYSQGGYVANEIADNQGILHDYHVGSVTTYGSPAARRPTKGVTYHHYAGKWDIVPALNRSVAHSLLSPTPGILEGSLLPDLLSLPAQLHMKIVSTPGPGLKHHHTSYGESPELAHEGLPFQPQTWETISTADTQATGGLSRPWQEKNWMGVTSRLFAYTSASQSMSIVDILPDSLYPTVDAARDKINDFIGQL